MRNLRRLAIIFLVSCPVFIQVILPAAFAQGETFTKTHQKKAESAMRALKGQTDSNNKIAMVHKKPKVLYFYAKWAVPCQLIEPKIKQSMHDWKEKVEFASIDVDDEANAETVNKYGVCPVPTVLYLDETGRVNQMDVGYSETKSITGGIKKLLHHS